LREPFRALSVILGRLGVKVLVYLTGKKGNKAVLFIEVEYCWLVLGIDYGKAAGGLVVSLGEPFLDEEENVAADAFAAKAFGHGQTADEYTWVAGEHFFAMGNLPHCVAPTAGQVVDADAVVGNCETGNDGLCVVLETEAVGLAHEEMGIVERVFTEELVHVVVSSAGEGMA